MQPAVSPFRASILAWSTFSGALLGAFAGFAAATVAWAITDLFPERWAIGRWRLAVSVLCVVLPAIAGALLGFLEGRLKLR